MSCFWSPERIGEAPWGLEQTDKRFFWYQEVLTIEADVELTNSQACFFHGGGGMSEMTS